MSGVRGHDGASDQPAAVRWPWRKSCRQQYCTYCGAEMISAIEERSRRFDPCTGEGSIRVRPVIVCPEAWAEWESVSAFACGPHDGWATSKWTMAIIVAVEQGDNRE